MSSKKKSSGKGGSYKRDLRREIFEVFRKNPNKTLNYKQVASAMDISDSGIRKLIFELLNEEAENETLLQPERGKFQLPASDEQESLQGIIQITRHGRGFVIIDGRSNDVEIRKEDTGTAFWGDRVEIELNERGRRNSGRVVKVLERAKDRYVGIIEMSGKNAFLLPSDQKIHIDFFISREDLTGAENGDKVVVELLSWKNPSRNPEGRVIKVLGKPGDHNVEMHAIMEEFGLPYEFPEEVLIEAEKISKEISQEEIANRRDFREVLTFTIDPEDAKDFDDALSYRELENGLAEVGIHIADVSHYLKTGTALENDAYDRATSVYLVDRVVPMLPEVLSNELCSLRPGEEKLCFSAVFQMDTEGEISSQWFGRTIIYSDRRFTYEEAQAIIETGEGDHAHAVVSLHKIALALRKKRMGKGGIDFDTEEVKFRLDEKGVPVYVFTKIMKDSNRLIEDFMLLANRKVAEFIGKVAEGKPKTFVYRIHDLPAEDRLANLRQFVSRFGYQLPRNNTQPLSLLRGLLDMSKDKPEEEIIKQMAIRSMAKAEYSIHNIGHFGLAFPHYTHFTSPIRRYPDVMVHRLLARYLEGNESAKESEYELRCKHSSQREKRATEAERASIKYKQVEFMSSRLGESFRGIISGITSWGMYVEIEENKCEGMVALSSMLDEYHYFDQDRYVIVGSKSGKEYGMGDRVSIRVIGADLQKRQLDFELIPDEPAMAAKKSMR
jgi:ribonuclease R